MEYEFIPIVYPNQPNDRSVPPPLAHTYDITTTQVVAGQGLPFIASAPYVAPAPVAEPTPLAQNGVLVDPAGTLTYRPLTELPATAVFNQTDNYSLPSLITTMGGDQSLYAPYDGAGEGSGKQWSLFPALQDVSMAGYGMTGMGNVVFAPDKTITGVKEISLTSGGFGSMTLNAEGIANTGLLAGVVALELNTQILTALPDALLLNGVPIATISDLPNIYQWANYPALSDVVMNSPGAGVPKKVIGAAEYGFDDGAYLASAQNPVSPANPGGTHTRMYVVDSSGLPTQNIIYSTDLSGGYEALGTYTGVPKWSAFPPQNNIDFNGKEITNINKITFNTAVPGLGGASINALNDLNFSLLTGAAGLAGINYVNNIAFWNPSFPGVPGSYVNLYTKKLSYNLGAESTYLASDTKLSVPALYTSIAPGIAGGKLEILGGNAQTATINGTPCSASWSQYPCTEPALDMNRHIIVNCASILFRNENLPPDFNPLGIDDAGYLTYQYPPGAGNTIRITPPNGWSAFPATQNVNMGAFDLLNTGRVVFDGDPNNILNTAGETLQWRGQPVQTGAAPDNVANWANYTAVANVNIPHQFKLNINGENYTPPFYPYQTSVLNTNIQHGDPGNEFECPDFDSYPVNFTVHNCRAVSLNSTSAIPLISGIGLNSVLDVNIEGLAFVGINSALLEVNGAATTINAETSILITTPECSITSGAITVNGVATVQIGGGTCEVTGLSLLALTTVGELNIAGGVTTMETGAFTASTGVGLWSAPSLTFAGGNVNIGGILTTMEAATMTINNTVGTNINSPVLAINSVTTTIAAGRTLEVDNIKPTTADSLVLTEVLEITGRTDVGMTVTQVQSITGHGSGMNLVNIDNFETYSANNVLLQTQYFIGAYANIVLDIADAQLAYTSQVKVWQYPNIPLLSYDVQITGRAVNNSGGGGGVPVNIAGYLVIKNLTHPAEIQLGTFVGEPTAIVTSVRPQGANFSFFRILFKDFINNDGDPMVQGDSYQIQLYLINDNPTPATDTILVSDGNINMTVSIGQNL